MPLPLALRDLRDRLLAGYYRQPAALAHDAATIAANAAAFNGPDSALAARAQGAPYLIALYSGRGLWSLPALGPAGSGTGHPSSCARTLCMRLLCDHANTPALAGDSSCQALSSVQSWRTLWRRRRMAAGRQRRSGTLAARGKAKKRRAPLQQARAGGAAAQAQGQDLGRPEVACCGGRARGGRGPGTAAGSQGQGRTV